MQGWKHRDRNQWHNNAGVETVGNRNNGKKLQGVENVRHEYSRKEYGKTLIATYM